MESPEEQRKCVRCGKPLPASSKMTEEEVAVSEARGNGWTGRGCGADSLTVAMCLACQIARAQERKHAAP
jgi:hypothetical protein